MVAQLFKGITTLIAAGMALLLLLFSGALALMVSGQVAAILSPYWLELLLGGYAVLAGIGLATGKVRPGLRWPAFMVTCLCILTASISLILRLL